MLHRMRVTEEDLLVRNAPSPGGRRAAQRQERPCSCKTGATEAASSAVATRCDAVKLTFWYSSELAVRGREGGERETHLVKSEWTCHCWNPLQYQVHLPRLDVFQGEPLQRRPNQQSGRAIEAREAHHHRASLIINQPDQCTGSGRPRLASH